jgi:GNAT superfamily N-acetyltransferase
VKTTHRNYNEAAEDFDRISRFIMERPAHIRSHSTWCLGRFVDWKYGLWGDKASIPDFWERNGHLWFDGFGDVVAFAIAESGGPDFAIITAEGYRFLFEEILMWVLEHWGDRDPALSIEITALQDLEARQLERYGFQRASSFYTFHHNLAEEPAQCFPLEEGFSIVDMHSRPDYRAQLALRLDAFQGKTEFSEEEIQEKLSLHSYSRESPIYHPHTDLCVVAPDGTFVSGCEALIDARNAEADIERVCTRPDFRRRGFAQAVIQECMLRLHRMGLQRCYITGYSLGAVGLYGSFGAKTRTESLIYRRAGADESLT